MPRGVKLNLVGQRFGRYLVTAKARTRNTVIYWHCICDCGNERECSSGNLRSGRNNSCGCLNDELLAIRMTTHGMSHSREYISWRGMLQRCYNKNNNQYENYGARGISVCDKWRDDFAAFYADMGARPKNKSIDRIDVDGNYEPRNCRWATQGEQSRNTRRASNGYSGLKGVYWNKRAKKFVVQIMVKGKRIYLGASDDFFEAACLRLSGENKYWTGHDD